MHALSQVGKFALTYLGLFCGFLLAAVYLFLVVLAEPTGLPPNATIAGDMTTPTRRPRARGPAIPLEEELFLLGIEEPPPRPEPRPEPDQSIKERTEMASREARQRLAKAERHFKTYAANFEQSYRRRREFGAAAGRFVGRPSVIQPRFRFREAFRPGGVAPPRR